MEFYSETTRLKQPSVGTTKPKINPKTFFVGGRRHIASHHFRGSATKKTHLLIRFRCFLRGIWAGWIIATQWFGRFWSNSLVPTRHWYNKGRWHEYLNFPYSFCVAGRWNPRISRFPVRCLMWNSVCLRRKYSKGIEIDCHYYILCVNVYCIYTVHIIFLSLLLSSSTIIVIITVVIITVSLSLYMPITRKP